MTSSGFEYNLGTGDNSAVAMSELLAVGPLNSFLVRGPSVSFWRYRYPRYGNFVMLSSAMPFQQSVRFGDSARVRLSNTSADLLYHLYLVVTLPGIHARERSRSRATGNDFPHDTAQMARDADRKAYHQYGKEYADGESDNRTDIGYAAMMLGNYGKASRYQSQDGSSDAYSSSSADNGYGSGSRNAWCHWANAIGQLLVKRAVLLVGPHPADVLTSDFLFMWEELTGEAGRRLREHIGKKRTRAQLIEMSRSDQTYYVPLPFYFTKASGSAYSLPSAAKTTVDVIIEFEQLRNCIVKSGRDVEVIKSSTNKRISRDDIRAHVDQTVVFVSALEREKFAESNFDQLMTQVQVSTTNHKGSRQFVIPLRFTHPIIELIWAVRRESKERANDWFNYSGIDNRDPLDTVALRFDNRYRFVGNKAPYYRLVTPRQAGHNVPKGYIYCQSFAIDAKDINPNGASNFSIFRDVDFIMKLQAGLENENTTAIVIGINFNIMRYKDQAVAAPLFH